jgi:hypothetical protein
MLNYKVNLLMFLLLVVSILPLKVLRVRISVCSINKQDDNSITHKPKKAIVESRKQKKYEIKFN